MIKKKKKKGLDPQYIEIGTLHSQWKQYIKKPIAGSKAKPEQGDCKKKKLSKVLLHFLNSGIFQEMLLNMQGWF